MNPLSTCVLVTGLTAQGDEADLAARSKLSSLGSTGAISSDALFGRGGSGGGGGGGGGSMRGRGESEGEALGDFMEKLGGQVSSDLRRVGSKVKDSTAKVTQGLSNLMASLR